MGTGKYLVRSVIVLLVAGLGGCLHLPVTMERLEWQPAVLSKEGCPDLTGVYRDRGILHRVFSAGLTKSKQDPADAEERPIAQVAGIKSWLSQGMSLEAMRDAYRAFSEHAILSIHHEGDVLQAKLVDDKGNVYERITVDLSTSRTGCYEGALVIRRMHVDRCFIECGGDAIKWEERIIRKLPDGSLQVTSRERTKALSFFAGAVRVTEGVLVYPAVTSR